MAGPLRALLLLWLAGVALRLTILAVPPVIPLIHDDLHLSETQVGILSGLPMVLFAGAAIAGSLMIARLGALTALLIGLVLCALGSALRGVGPNVAMLYFGTVVTAFGVAVMQPSLPPLVRAWVPQRIGFATAVYTNGLIIGEILPAALTIPLVLPLLEQSWQWQLSCSGRLPVARRSPWSIVAFRAACAGRGADRRPAGAGCRTFAIRMIWRIGLLLGSVNATYFSLNGFLPDYLTHTGRPDLIQRRAHRTQPRPASGIVPAARLGRPDGAHHVVVSDVCGVDLLCLACWRSCFSAASGWSSAARVWGCFGAAVLVLVLALPPLISPPEDVHRVSAGMFTISYSCAVIVPIIGGALWDLTGWTLAPFIPIGVCIDGRDRPCAHHRAAREKRGSLSEWVTATAR